MSDKQSDNVSQPLDASKSSSNTGYQHQNKHYKFNQQYQQGQSDQSTNILVEYASPDTYLTPSKEHKLWTPFTFWLCKKNALQNIHQYNAAGDQHKAYLSHFEKIGPFDTIEEFWKIYTYLAKPFSTTQYMYHCFRSDLDPTWEHEGNKAGGRLQVRCKRGWGERVFETVLFSVLANEYRCEESICGVVLNIKKNEDLVSLWLNVSQCKDTSLNNIDRIRYVVKRILSSIIASCDQSSSMASSSTTNTNNQTISFSSLFSLDFLPHASRSKPPHNKKNAVHDNTSAATTTTTPPVQQDDVTQQIQNLFNE